jgi:hypothetical protein
MIFKISVRRLLLLSLLFAKIAGAQNAGDPASDEALLKTQALLNDPKALKALQEVDEKAKKVDQSIDKMTKGDAAKKAEIYSISADVLQSIIAETGGDEKKLEALLLKAQSDPEGFYNSLSPAQKARIKAASGENKDVSPK